MKSLARCPDNYKVLRSMQWKSIDTFIKIVNCEMKIYTKA